MLIKGMNVVGADILLEDEIREERIGRSDFLETDRCAGVVHCIGGACWWWTDGLGCTCVGIGSTSLVVMGSDSISSYIYCCYGFPDMCDRFRTAKILYRLNHIPMPLNKMIEGDLHDSISRC